MNDRWRMDFERDGYLVLPGFVDGQACETLKARMDELVAAFDPSDVATIFSTTEQLHAQADYFLSSGDKIRFFADPTGAYAVTLGVNIDGIPFFGTPRYSRFAMTIEDGVITHFDVEPDKFGVSCSLSAPLLAKIG